MSKNVEANVTCTKLRGMQNYHTWVFAMTNVLDYFGLEKCIADPVTEEDADKLKKAKARIVMSIDESLFVHIMNETTASGVWKRLKQMFDDTGLSRKIGLLRKLITTRL